MKSDVQARRSPLFSSWLVIVVLGTGCSSQAFDEADSDPGYVSPRTASTAKAPTNNAPKGPNDASGAVMSADAAAPATPAKDSAPSATPDAGQPGTAPSKPATPDAAQPGTAPTKPDASSPPPWVPPVTTVPPATTGSPGFPGVPTGPMEPPTWVPPATTVSPGIPEVPTWPTLPTRPPEVVILPVCLPETAAVFCARQGAQCGTKNALDNCGSYRSEFCGGCASGQFCDASNQCQWIPIQEPPVPICISNFNANEACRQHASVDRCKTINVRDNCGKDRDVNCANVWFPNNATCTRICPNSGCR